MKKDKGIPCVMCITNVDVTKNKQQAQQYDEKKETKDGKKKKLK
jgi:hypothetical protein